MASQVETHAQLLHLDIPTEQVIHDNKNYWKMYVEHDMLVVPVETSPFGKEVVKIYNSSDGPLITTREQFSKKLAFIITSHHLWPAMIALRRRELPRYDANNGTLLFFFECEQKRHGICPMDTTVILFYEQFASPRYKIGFLYVFFEAPYCLHEEWSFVSRTQYPDEPDEVATVEPMTVPLLDLENPRITNLAHLTNKNRNMAYNARNSAKSDQYHHKIISQSLHLMHINDHVNYSKPISSLSNNQIGYIQDPMVGLEFSFSIYSYESALLWQIASYLKLTISLDATEGLALPMDYENTPDSVKFLFHFIFMPSIVKGMAAPLAIVVTGPRDYVHISNKFFCMFNRLRRMAECHKLHFKVYCWMIDISLIYIMTLCQIGNGLSVPMYKLKALQYIMNENENKQPFICSIILICLFHQLCRMRKWFQDNSNGKNKKEKLDNKKTRAIKSLAMRIVRFINRCDNYKKLISIICLCLYLFETKKIKITLDSSNNSNNNFSILLLDIINI